MSPKQYINNRKSYHCKDCREWFRLKLAFLQHKCLKKDQIKETMRNNQK